MNTVWRAESHVAANAVYFVDEVAESRHKFGAFIVAEDILDVVV